MRPLTSCSCRRSMTEGSPMVLLETSAAGTPVIASNLGGLRETVTPENWPAHRADRRGVQLNAAGHACLIAPNWLRSASEHAVIAERRFSDRNVDLIVHQYGFDVDNGPSMK